MIYILQLVAILFTFVIAKFNAPSVVQFRNNGVTDHVMSEFHRYSAFTRLVFVLGIAVAAGIPAHSFWKAIEVFTICGLWVDLLFDPVLNKLTGQKWDYLGTNDESSRMWISWFKEEAGRRKAELIGAILVLYNIASLL